MRLLEVLQPSDPVTDDEIWKIQGFLASQLLALTQAVNEFTPINLIGSSGSFDTFADLIIQEKNSLQNSGDISQKINPQKYRAMHGRLLDANRQERLDMPGMLEMRVDMIVIASIMTEYIFDRYRLRSLHVSSYALKEGALSEMA